MKIEPVDEFLLGDGGKLVKKAISWRIYFFTYGANDLLMDDCFLGIEMKTGENIQYLDFASKSSEELKDTGDRQYRNFFQVPFEAFLKKVFSLINSN